MKRIQQFVLCLGSFIPAYTIYSKFSDFQFFFCILFLSGEKELETHRPWEHQLGFVKIDISWTG